MKFICMIAVGHYLSLPRFASVTMLTDDAFTKQLTIFGLSRYVPVTRANQWTRQKKMEKNYKFIFTLPINISV